MVRPLPLLLLDLPALLEIDFDDDDDVLLFPAVLLALDMAMRVFVLLDDFFFEDGKAVKFTGQHARDISSEEYEEVLKKEKQETWNMLLGLIEKHDGDKEAH